MGGKIWIIALLLVAGCETAPRDRIVCTPIPGGYENKSYINGVYTGRCWTNSNEFVNGQYRQQ